MKGLSVFLRVLGGITACFLVLASALLLMARLCFFDGERYVEAVLTQGFYEKVEESRVKGLASLGTMVEMEEGRLDEFVSARACRELSEEYVGALVSDLLEGTDRAVGIGFSSPELLAFLKEDYTGYDFTESGYASSDKAAEAAYAMICGTVDSAVLFVPEKISRNLDAASGLISTALDYTSFWFVPFLAAVAIYAAMFFIGANKTGNLFGVAASFWCAAILCFVPIVILFFGSDARYLEFDRNALYYFLSGCIGSVRSAALAFSGVFFVVATAFILPVGLRFTAARTLIVPEPPIAEDFVAAVAEEDVNGDS